MPAIRSGDRQTLGLDPGKVLTVSADSISSAIVRTFASNTQGIESNGQVSVPAGGAQSFGPYLVPQRFVVEGVSGEVAYVVGDQVPSAPLEKPVSIDAKNAAVKDGKSAGYLARSPFKNQFQNPLALLNSASLTEWNDLAGSGVTATLDTAVKFNGQPTIRLDIPANYAGGTCRIGTSGATVRIPYSWDRTNLAYAIRCSNNAALGNTLALIGDAAFTNYWAVNNQSPGNQPQMQYATGDWMVFKPGLSDQAATGSPTVASLMRARLTFNVSNVGTATQIWIGFFGVMPKRPKPTLVMSFDDGFASFNSFIRPLFKHHRIPCSFAIVSSLIGASANYMTEVQMLDLHNDSSGLFEMLNHNRIHQNVNSYASAQAYYDDVEVCRRFLQDRGITKGCYHHVYPNSIWRDDVSALLDAGGYFTGRASTASINGEYQDQMIKSGDKMRWKLNVIANLQTGTTPANVQTAINSLKTSGGVGFINAHDFQSADGSFIYSYENMTQVAGIIAAERDAGNIELMRYSDWYDTYVA